MDIISIPSGAIKREIQKKAADIAIGISIPSGAIKRLHNNKLGIGLNNFNSFWCD